MVGTYVDHHAGAMRPQDGVDQGDLVEVWMAEPSNDWSQRVQ
jgi:hypothetical protein